MSFLTLRTQAAEPPLVPALGIAVAVSVRGMPRLDCRPCARALLAACATVFASWGTAAHAERLGTLDPERIREAIAFGESAPESDLAQYELERDQGYVINCDTPFLRVAQLARAMKTSDASLDDERVSPRLAAEVIHLYVHQRAEAVDGPRPRVESVSLEGTPLSLQAVRPSRSVKAVIPMSALVLDAWLTIRFEDGTTRQVRINPDWLSRLR